MGILTSEWEEGNREERMPKVMRSSISIIINRVILFKKPPETHRQTIDHHHLFAGGSLLIVDM